jgi:ornithine carbamoyltransferase
MNHLHGLVIGDVDDLDPAVLRRLVEQPFEPAGELVGLTVAGVFEHPSMRTRSALGVAAAALGGSCVFFVGEEVGIDTREPAEDVAEVLARHHAIVAARLRRHDAFERMARRIAAHGRPFVNLLTDRAHPTQAIADLITIHEAFGTLEGVEAAWIGDANNVARSFALALGALGGSVRICAPEGYGFSDADLASIRSYVRRAGRDPAAVGQVSDPGEAARGASVLATDVWVSMGEDPAKRAAFRGWSITEALVDEAAPEAIVLHCLPAHRGEEIEASVIEGPHSRVFRQAEHRATAMVRVLGYLAGESGAVPRLRW